MYGNHVNFIMIDHLPVRIQSKIVENKTQKKVKKQKHIDTCTYIHTKKLHQNHAKKDNFSLFLQTFVEHTKGNMKHERIIYQQTNKKTLTPKDAIVNTNNASVLRKD